MWFRYLVILLLIKLYVHEAECFFSHRTHPNYYDDLTDYEPFHLRLKRSIFSTFGLSSTCDPGYTGQFCENPICSSLGNVQRTASSMKEVDTIHLPSGCSGKYYVPLDNSSRAFMIEVVTDGPSCSISLSDANGMLLNGEGGSKNEQCYKQFDTFSPGAYQLTVDTAGMPTKSCHVSIKAFSDLNVNQGFSLSPQEDDIPYADSAIDGLPMYFVAHTDNLSAPGYARTVTLRNDNTGSIIYRSTLTSRFGCAYEQFAGQFTCSKDNFYAWSVDGIDSSGFSFRRSGRFSCYEPPTTTSIPTVGPPSQCSNNGYLLNSGTAEASCFCPELFTGRQCEKLNCMNGGIPSSDGLTCECSENFKGDNCQHLECVENYGSFLLDKRSLIVVIRNTVSMKHYYDSIIAAVTDAYSKSAYAGEDVYADYVLVRFNNGTYKPTSYSNYANFLSDLKNLKKTAQDVVSCSDTSFDAIYSVFVQEIFDNSPILFITDAVAQDYQNWRKVTEANSRRKFPIYSFILPQDSCELDTMDVKYLAINNAAQYSGGLSFRPSTPANLQNVLKLAIITSTYSMNQVLADDMIQCSTNGYRSFLIDSTARDVYIVITGNNINLDVVDPSGNQTKALPIFSDNYDNFFEITDVIPGEYLMHVSGINEGDSACSVRVLSRSDFEFFFATTTDDSIDAIDSEPVVGKNIHFVAHLNGLSISSDPYRLFAELTITTNLNQNDNQYQKPMYYSSGIWRDGCGYQLYFGVADFCEFPDQQFYATLYADDNKGYTIQRTTIGYCSLIPTTVSPPDSCQNGGVKLNETCFCRVGFNGNYCEQIVCQNGGTPAGSYCICPTGTSGTFCELYACTTKNPSPSLNFEEQSMTWVVSTRSTMKDVWTQLANGVSDFVRDNQYISNTWIKSWIVVIVNAKSSNILVNSEYPSDFISAIVKVSTNFSSYTVEETGCSVQIEAGLRSALSLSEKNSHVYVFADSDGPDDFDVNLKITSLLSKKITINLVGSGNMCTGSGDGQFPSYIREFSEESGGFIYYTSKIQSLLLYMNTMYRSQVVGYVGQNDCSNYTGFFAVDNLANSLSIAVTGSNLTSVVVTTPNGEQQSLEVSLINENNLNARLLLPSCPTIPQQWNYREQMCYLFNGGPKSWNEASLECHLYQGSLIDIYDQSKQDYVNSQVVNMEIWIGLRRHNNSWVWDIPEGNHASNLENHYTNWCPGFPTNDPNTDCVALSSDNCWKNIDCSLKKLKACQTLRYNPNAPGDNTLPGGRYQIDIKGGKDGCMAQIRTQSQIMINFGFVQDPHNDFPESEANIDSSSNYLVAHADMLPPFQYDVNPTMEARLNYAIFGSNNSLTNALQLSNRFCNFEMISESFSCKDNSQFFIKFSGIDQLGYPFERYSNFECKTFASVCMNGGFYYNGFCVCTQDYVGARCILPVCQNGGVLLENSLTCQCTGGYTGKFCETPMCEPSYPYNFKDTGKTLAILLETSFNMGGAISQLQNNLTQALNNIKNDPTTAGWFSNYIFYPFDSASNKDQWYNIVSSTNSDDIVKALNDIPLMSCPGNNCSPNCPRPIMEVLKNTLTHPDFNNPDSVVLVITRSSPEDSVLVDEISTILQQSRVQINFVLPISSPCGEGWDSPGAKAMYFAEQYSDGNIFTMSVTEISDFLMKYLPTIYSSSGVEFFESNRCTEEEIIFQVENGMTDFTIDFVIPQTDPAPVIQLTDPKGELVPLPNSILPSSDTNYLGVVNVDSSLIGTYRFSLTGGQNNTCMINIRARSTIEIFPGYVDSTADAYDGATRDDAYAMPVFWKNNTIVVHANNLVNGSLTYVQFVDPWMGLIHTTSLKRRESSCSFEWYGVKPFVAQSRFLKTIIYGIDSTGENFRRIFRTSPVNDAPKPKPPPVRTFNNNPVDLLFLIDSSSAIHQETFNAFISFAGIVTERYKLSSTYAQVGVETLADQPHIGFDLNSTKTHDDLVQKLNGLSFLNVPGQNLTAAVQMAIDHFTDPNYGYRSKPVRHLIVYLTGTQPTDSDPGQLLYSLRKSGSFGFATIALNMESNQVLDNIMSSNCLYYSPDDGDLNNYGVNFIQQLTNSRVNFCGM